MYKVKSQPNYSYSVAQYACILTFDLEMMNFPLKRFSSCSGSLPSGTITIGWGGECMPYVRYVYQS